MDFLVVSATDDVALGHLCPDDRPGSTAAHKRADLCHLDLSRSMVERELARAVLDDVKTESSANNASSLRLVVVDGGQSLLATELAPGNPVQVRSSVRHSTSIAASMSLGRHR